MKGAALARAAKGWHADARDKALGADLKNEDIVYMFCELSRLELEFDITKLRLRLRHFGSPDFGFSVGVVYRRLHRASFILRDNHFGLRKR
jgi:hypothetical protein